MKSFPLSLCLALLLATSHLLLAQDAALKPGAWSPAFGERARQNHWRLETFDSATLGHAVGYYLYLPPDYAVESDKRYPVVYWLHGLGGSPASANPVVNMLDSAIRAGQALPMMLVACTDPTKRSMWTDSKDGTVPVETVIVKELVPHIDATHRTLDRREWRAIEGYSMGGFGAAYLGFKYPEVFGVVSVLAGALHTPESLKTRREQIFAGVYDGDSDYAQARSPWRLLESNAAKLRYRSSVRVHVGEHDALREWNTELHHKLDGLGIDNTFSLVPESGHSPKTFFANWEGNFFDFYHEAFGRVRRFTYKETPQGPLDMVVHLPPDWRASDRRPAIVFFFGGGWRGGTIDQFAPQARYLASRGMVAARADYRVLSRHKTKPDKCVEDGKSAVRWFRARASTLGIDPERICAAGGSAGGHVAACTFTTPGLDAAGEDLTISSQPNLMVLFNPVMDVMAERRVVRIGSQAMAQKLSPNQNLSAKVPPSILFFGTDDDLALDSYTFIRLAQKLGIQAELYLANQQRHGFFNRTPWLERTSWLMDRFLAHFGYTESTPTVALPGGKVEMVRYNRHEEDPVGGNTQ